MDLKWATDVQKKIVAIMCHPQLEVSVAFSVCIARDFKNSIWNYLKSNKQLFLQSCWRKGNYFSSKGEFHFLLLEMVGNDVIFLLSNRRLIVVFIRYYIMSGWCMYIYLFFLSHVEMVYFPLFSIRLQLQVFFFLHEWQRLKFQMYYSLLIQDNSWEKESSLECCM